MFIVSLPSLKQRGFEMEVVLMKGKKTTNKETTSTF